MKIPKAKVGFYFMICGGIFLLLLFSQGFFFPAQEHSRWDIVITRTLLLSMFIIFLPFKKKISRWSSSATIAFIAAFYAEMYGFPLTFFLLTTFFESQFSNPIKESLYSFLYVISPFMAYFYHFFLVYLPLLGFILVLLGWSKIYKSQRKGEGELVTAGVYSSVRHPQYLGFLIATFGFLLAWPTIMTIITWPILVVLYYRLAKEEEKEMEKKFPKKFSEYKRKVPMFIPFRLKIP